MDKISVMKQGPSISFENSIIVGNVKKFEKKTRCLAIHRPRVDTKNRKSSIGRKLKGLM